MRFIVVIVAILLTGAGVAVFFSPEVAAIVLAVVAIIFRRFIGKIVWLLSLMVMPMKWRRAYQALAKSLTHATLERFEVVRVRWIQATWPIRFAMLIAGGLCGGFAAFVLLIMPVHVGKIPFIGIWMREVATPYLMRSATLKGLEAHVPLAWKRIPAQIRAAVSGPYMRLWWYTARKLVGTRQALGKRAAAVSKGRTKH